MISRQQSCLSQTHTQTLQIFALIPGDLLLSIFSQVLDRMKQLFIDKAEYISMHIHIHFQKNPSVILFSLKLLISISVFFHREQFRELLPYGVPSNSFCSSLVPVTKCNGRPISQDKEIPSSPSVQALPEQLPRVPKPRLTPGPGPAGCQMTSAAAHSRWPPAPRSRLSAGMAVTSGTFHRGFNRS